MKNPDKPTPLAYCIVNGCAVFLDIDADRYFCLPADLNRAFLNDLENPNSLDDCDLQRLVLHRVHSDGSKAPAPISPRVTLPREALEPGRPGKFLLKAALAQSVMQFRLKRWSFARIMQVERSRSNVRSRPKDLSDVAHLYASFCALTSWFGEADQCLARALAFRMIALRHGQAATLVIGVKLDPFAAHCWIQDDLCILSDRFERIRLFTPILVV